MKKFILLAVMFLVGAFAAGAQTTKVSENVIVEGKTYKATKSVKSSNDIATDYMWYIEKENQQYPIYLHKYTKGDKAGQWTTYVIRVSKKTGKEYKYYLSQGIEVAADIIRNTPNIIKGFN